MTTISPTAAQTPQGLVVVLHGWGANAQDLIPIAAALDLPDYQFLFPNAPFPHPYAPTGRMWYDLENRDHQGLDESRRLLKTWLQSLADQTNVPLSRTVLSGFSQGGAMTLDVGLALPVAGLISLSGYLHPLNGLSKESFPPVAIAHGRNDPVVPLQMAQQARDVLVALGVNVQYQEFEMGHEIQSAVLGLMQQFILARLS